MKTDGQASSSESTDGMKILCHLLARVPDAGFTETTTLWVSSGVSEGVVTGSWLPESFATETVRRLPLRCQPLGGGLSPDCPSLQRARKPIKKKVIGQLSLRMRKDTGMLEQFAEWLPRAIPAPGGASPTG